MTSKPMKQPEWVEAFDKLPGKSLEELTEPKSPTAETWREDE